MKELFTQFPDQLKDNRLVFQVDAPQHHEAVADVVSKADQIANEAAKLVNEYEDLPKSKDISDEEMKRLISVSSVAIQDPKAVMLAEKYGISFGKMAGSKTKNLKPYVVRKILEKKHGKLSKEVNDAITAVVKAIPRTVAYDPKLADRAARHRAEEAEAGSQGLISRGLEALGGNLTKKEKLTRKRHLAKLTREVVNLVKKGEGVESFLKKYDVSFYDNAEGSTSANPKQVKKYGLKISRTNYYENLGINDVLEQYIVAAFAKKYPNAFTDAEDKEHLLASLDDVRPAVAALSK